jgi:uncharacterized protein
MEDDIEIHMYEDIDLENAMLIESFPTVGLVSTIVASFIVDALKLRRVGAIISSHFPPAAVVMGGQPSPPMRIYAGPKVCGPNKECDQVVILTSEFSVPDEMQLPLAHRILDWAKEKKVRIILSVEGTGTPEDIKPGTEPEIFYACSTESACKMAQRYEMSPMKMGIITGISGVLLYLADMEKRDLVCLLAPAHTNFPDARAAAKLVKTIDEMLPMVEIDTGPLLEEAAKIEKNIQGALEMMRKGLETRKKVGEPPMADMYR